MIVCAGCFGKFDVTPIHGVVFKQGTCSFFPEGRSPIPYLCPTCARAFPSVYEEELADAP
jgi:hypothetical protein